MRHLRNYKDPSLTDKLRTINEAVGASRSQPSEDLPGHNKEIRLCLYSMKRLKNVQEIKFRKVLWNRSGVGERLEMMSPFRYS